MFLFSKNAVVKSVGLNDTSSHNHGSGERVPLRLSFTIGPMFHFHDSEASVPSRGDRMRKGGTEPARFGTCRRLQMYVYMMYIYSTNLYIHDWDTDILLYRNISRRYYVVFFHSFIHSFTFVYSFILAVNS